MGSTKWKINVSPTEANPLSSLPIFALVCDYTRPGSDFFQSLLDGHPQIIQLTGSTAHRIGDFYAENRNLPSVDLAQKFAFSPQFASLFDSRFNRRERWHMLGERKADFFKVSVEDFLEQMSKISPPDFDTFLNFFLAVHLSYTIAGGDRLDNKKIILFHMHRLDLWEMHYQDFPTMKFICMTRDLRDGLYSGVCNVPDSYNYKNTLYPVQDIFSQYGNTHRSLEQHPEKLIVRLEDLHSEPQAVLRRVADFLQVSFIEKIMMVSSYRGLLWWGDEWSKVRNGFREGGVFFPNPWKNWLSPTDQYSIELVYGDILEKLGYEINQNRSAAPRLLRLLLAFRPLTIETVILIGSPTAGLWRVIKEVRFYLLRVKAFLVEIRNSGKAKTPKKNLSNGC